MKELEPQPTDYLYKFAETRTVFDGDVGQLVGIDSGGLGGVAFLDTLCSQGNYSYGRSVAVWGGCMKGVQGYMVTLGVPE